MNLQKAKFRNQLGVNLLKLLLDDVDPECIDNEDYVDQAFELADLVVAKIEAYEADCHCSACEEACGEQQKKDAAPEDLVEILLAALKRDAGH